MKLTLEEAIQRLRLPELSRRLAIAGEIPERDGKTARCFFPDRHANGDRNPSFNFYNELTTFKCHACGVSGRGPDLISMILGLDKGESIRRFIQMAGGTTSWHHQPARKQKSLRLPDDLRSGKAEDIATVARLRDLDPKALALASGMGILKFGTVLGFNSWIVTDEAHQVAEARRMDGKSFPPIGSLGERKAHTLAGSKKTWPVGLHPCHPKRDLFRRIVLVEGGPDLLAAYHFLLTREEFATLPVGILGKNCSITPSALCEFRGREVKIIPHADLDGGGIEAAHKWADCLSDSVGARISLFKLQGLRRSDGKQINDLNDCVHLHPEDQPEIKGLFS